MIRVTARLPEALVRNIDDAARSLNRSRAQIIRQAIEYYLADVDDLRLRLESLKDPADPVLDWDEVKRDLLAADQKERSEGSRKNPRKGAITSRCQVRWY